MPLSFSGGPCEGEQQVSGKNGHEEVLQLVFRGVSLQHSLELFAFSGHRLLLCRLAARFNHPNCAHAYFHLGS